MGSTFGQRDILSNAGNTLSSWDSCMAKSYCKWPVVIGIIIGSLIILSLLFCCARCLCCGVECCCGICSCFNRCCPSPRRKNRGYEQAAPAPYPQPYQYQQPPPMHPPHYASGAAGYRNMPTTAVFDTPSKGSKFDEDKLPAMPSWENATSRRVEQPAEDMELEKMEPIASPAYTGQQDALLLTTTDNSRYYDGGQTSPRAADLGAMNANGHDYDQHQHQISPGPFGAQRNMSGYHLGAQTAQTPYTAPDSPYGAQHASYGDVARSYSPSNYTNPGSYRSPMSAGGFHTGAQQRSLSPVSYAPTNAEYYGNNQPHSAPSYAQPKSYETPSPVAPSYHTSAQQGEQIVSPLSPPPQLTPGGGIGRKPVQGSWREV